MSDRELMAKAGEDAVNLARAHVRLMRQPRQQSESEAATFTRACARYIAKAHKRSLTARDRAVISVQWGLYQLRETQSSDALIAALASAWNDTNTANLMLSCISPADLVRTLDQCRSYMADDPENMDGMHARVARIIEAYEQANHLASTFTQLRIHSNVIMSTQEEEEDIVLPPPQYRLSRAPTMVLPQSDAPVTTLNPSRFLRQQQIANLCAIVLDISPEMLVARLRMLVEDAEADLIQSLSTGAKRPRI